MAFFGWTPRKIQQTFCDPMFSGHSWRLGRGARQCTKCGRHETEIPVPVGRSYQLTDPFDIQPPERWTPSDPLNDDMK